MLVLGCTRRAALAVSSIMYPSERRPLWKTLACHRVFSGFRQSARSWRSGKTKAALPQDLMLTKSSLFAGSSSSWSAKFLLICTFGAVRHRAMTEPAVELVRLELVGLAWVAGLGA